MNKKKIIGGMEMVLMVVAVFAFSYGVSESNEFFGEVDDYGGNLRVGFFGRFVGKIIEILVRPVVGVVSAESWNETLDSGRVLTHTTNIQN